MAEREGPGFIKRNMREIAAGIAALGITGAMAMREIKQAPEDKKTVASTDASASKQKSEYAHSQVGTKEAIRIDESSEKKESFLKDFLAEKENIESAFTDEQIREIVKKTIPDAVGFDMSEAHGPDDMRRFEAQGAKGQLYYRQGDDGLTLYRLDVPGDLDPDMLSENTRILDLKTSEGLIRLGNSQISGGIIGDISHGDRERLGQQIEAMMQAAREFEGITKRVDGVLSRANAKNEIEDILRSLVEYKKHYANQDGSLLYMDKEGEDEINRYINNVAALRPR